MSDYEVNLVNDSMQEFYVKFYGPTESKPSSPIASGTQVASLTRDRPTSTVRWRSVEDSRRAARSVSVQVTQHRLHEQDIPPEHRRAVRPVRARDAICADRHRVQQWLGLSRRH